MIKKKTPVMLVTIVAAFGLGMVALNLTQYLRSPGGIMEIEAPDKAALEAVRKRQAENAATRKPTAKELRMHSQLGVGGSTATLANGVPLTPSIDMPNMKQVAPKFDPETTSSHWYEDTSAQKAKADEKKTTSTG